MTFRRLSGLGAIALTLACTGCGLPHDQRPSQISASNVPYGLLQSAPAGATPVVGGSRTPVYFVRGAHLVVVNTRVPGVNVPAEAVRTLLAGPPVSDVDSGVTSAIPAGTQLISLDVEGEDATVDLSTNFGQVGGTEQVLAVAQIVYTLTAAQQITGVSFALNSRPIEVPDGRGSLSSQPRDPTDYRREAPAS